MEGYSADDLIGLRVVGNSSKATAVIRKIDTELIEFGLIMNLQK